MGVIFPKGSYPNIQSTPKMVSYLGGDLVLTYIQIHHITEELQTTVAIVFTLFWWLVDNEETDKLLDSIL